MNVLNNGLRWMTSLNRVSNFALKETECRCGCEFNDVRQGLIDILQIIRDTLGRPVKINCALRCCEHNSKVSDTKNSFHTRGMAADIAVFDKETSADMDSEKLYAVIDLLPIPCIIKYPGQRFCHIDIRSGGPQRYTYKNGVYIPIIPLSGGRA